MPKRAPQVLRDFRVFRAKLDLQDQRETRETREQLARREFKVKLGHRGQLELMGRQALRDFRVQWVRRERSAPRARRVLRENKVLRGQSASSGAVHGMKTLTTSSTTRFHPGVAPGLLALILSSDRSLWTAAQCGLSLHSKEVKVQLERLERRDPRGHRGLQAQPVPLVPLELMADFRA